MVFSGDLQWVFSIQPKNRITTVVETFEFSKFYSWYENISLVMTTFLITFVDTVIVHSGASRLAMFSITFAHAKHQIIKTQINAWLWCCSCCRCCRRCWCCCTSWWWLCRTRTFIDDQEFKKLWDFKFFLKKRKRYDSFCMTNSSILWNLAVLTPVNTWDGPITYFWIDFNIVIGPFWCQFKPEIEFCFIPEVWYHVIMLAWTSLTTTIHFDNFFLIGFDFNHLVWITQLNRPVFNFVLTFGKMDLEMTNTGQEKFWESFIPGGIIFESAENDSEIGDNLRFGWQTYPETWPHGLCSSGISYWQIAKTEYYLLLQSAK